MFQLGNISPTNSSFKFPKPRAWSKNLRSQGKAGILDRGRTWWPVGDRTPCSAISHLEVDVHSSIKRGVNKRLRLGGCCEFKAGPVNKAPVLYQVSQAKTEKKNCLIKMINDSRGGGKSQGEKGREGNSDTDKEG